MKDPLIAHAVKSADSGKVSRSQTLEEHSRNVAQLCAALCRPAGLEKTGELTGWLHDFGKGPHAVQVHIKKGTKEKLNHSAAGMRWIWEHTATAADFIRLTGQIVALAIGCHHSGRRRLLHSIKRQKRFCQKGCPQMFVGTLCSLVWDLFKDSCSALWWMRTGPIQPVL